MSLRSGCHVLVEKSGDLPGAGLRAEAHQGNPGPAGKIEESFQALAKLKDLPTREQAIEKSYAAPDRPIEAGIRSPRHDRDWPATRLIRMESRRRLANRSGRGASLHVRNFGGRETIASSLRSLKSSLDA